MVAEYPENHDYLVPIMVRGGVIEGLLAEYFDINVDVLDHEKRAMLMQLREEV